VIPSIITQIASGQRNLKLGALHPTRDFNFVTDTVRAFEAVMNSDEALGQVLNAGSGFEVSIGDTVRMIAQAMGVEVTIETDEVRLRPEKSEVERLLADNRRLRTLTDWAPEYGGIDGFRRGLAKTIEWFTDQSNLATYKADRYNV
jgi:dTDP-glucose 4,6-dehydratase